MAWLEKRKRWRIREWIDGKKVTVVEDAGIWKEIAEARLTAYRKSVAGGADNNALAARRVAIEEGCDIFFEKHTPGLKPTSRRDMGYRLDRIKVIWKGKMLDDITEYDVRDLLARYGSVGDRLKYLRCLTTLFRRFKKWNKTGKVLGFIVKIPADNPATEWRAEMKASEKKELPDTRVLSEEEWHRFHPHLTKRAFAICNLALRRFLRTCDIRQISRLNISDEMIRGLQAKTGEPFRVPVLDNQPTRYDFTNFRDEFLQAQIKAGMNYPVGHVLHFNVRTLRRTGATWAYRKTRDLVGIQKMLGHTNIRTTIRYLNLEDADLTKIAKAVDKVAMRRGAPVGQNRVNGHR